MPAVTLLMDRIWEDPTSKGQRGGTEESIFEMLNLVYELGSHVGVLITRERSMSVSSILILLGS